MEEIFRFDRTTPRPTTPGTPYSLYYNVRADNVDGVKADLAAGVDPNVVDTSQRFVVDRPIRVAVSNWPGSPSAKQIVKLLLKSGANPNLPNPPLSDYKTLSVQDAVYLPELMRLLLLDPDTKIKVDPSMKLPLFDNINLMYSNPPRWPPGPYPLREYIMKSWAPPVNERYRPIHDEIRDEMVAMVDKAIHNRAVGVKKALNQTTLSPDVIRLIAQMDSGHIPKPKSGGRRFTRKQCKKFKCAKMGFTQKASCRPYKNCYRSTAGVHKKRGTHKHHGRK
jgi:hypothetical protein